MKNFFAFLIVATVSFQAFAQQSTAADQYPALPEGDVQILLKRAENPKIVECMANYEFDFFAKLLINGQDSDWSKMSDSEKKETIQGLQQFSKYLNTGKLQAKPGLPAIPRDVQNRCEIIANALTEGMAVKAKALIELMPQIGEAIGKAIADSIAEAFAKAFGGTTDRKSEQPSGRQ